MSGNHIGFARSRASGVALCVVFSSGISAAHAAPQTKVPTPSQFQAKVPQSAVVQYSRHVSGNAAVDALAKKLGVDTHAFAQVLGANLQNLGPDPLGIKGTAKTATWQHTEQTSGKEVPGGSRSDDSMMPVAVGDTYAMHWSAGGWDYGAASSWNGQAWEPATYSARKKAPHDGG